MLFDRSTVRVPWLGPTSEAKDEMTASQSVSDGRTRSLALATICGKRDV